MASVNMQRLNFEPGPEGTHASVFVAHAGQLRIRLRSRGFDLISNSQTHLSIQFVGANPVRIVGANRRTSQSNYFIGSDPSKWRTHVPNFGSVKYSDLYPRTDLIFYGNAEHLEHDFVLSPGADPSRIRLRISGQTAMSLEPDGSLKVASSGGELRFQAPSLYQDTLEGRHIISGQFSILGRDEVGFRVASYDRSLPLVIDPVLTYSTYLANVEVMSPAVATDSAGNTYIVGIAPSGYPTTGSAFQQSCSSCNANTSDVFVTKLSADGSHLIYSTYLSSSQTGQPSGIAVDANGDAIVVGWTGSKDFPVKNQIVLGATGEAETYGFITSLSPDGSSLNFSTLVGGAASAYQSSNTFITAITCDANGSAYAGGTTDSSVLPVTPGALNAGVPSYNTPLAFLMKLSSSGNLLTSAILGSPDEPVGASLFTGISAIQVGPSGNLYLAGRATSAWTATSGSYQTQVPTGSTAAPFVAKISPDESTLLYSTFIGQGEGNAPSLTVDANGDAFITGNGAAPSLNAPNNIFPTTPNAYQTSSGNSFLSELNPTGSQLVYSTLFGTAVTHAESVALDGSGNVWMAGITQDPQFPLEHPLESIPATKLGFLTEFDPTLSNLLFSTYLGSASQNTQIFSMAIDPLGKIHVAGSSTSGLYATPGAYLPTVPSGNQNVPYGFAAVIDPSVGSPAVCFGAPQNLGMNFGSVTVGNSANLTLTLTNCGTQTLNVSSLQSSSSAFTIPSSSNNCLQPVPANSSCTVTVTFTPVAGTNSATLSVISTASVPTTLPLNGVGAVPKIQVVISPNFNPQLVGQTSAQQPMLIKNVGNSTLTVNLAATTITSGFTFASVSCNQPVAPNQVCTLFLTFTALVAGNNTGTLSLASNDPLNPNLAVPLSGTGYSSYPVPLISYLNPPTVPIGSPSVLLTVAGANFFPASVIEINGVPQTTAYVSNSNLTTTLNSSQLSGYGEFQVSVVNPTPGGGQSLPAVLTMYRLINQQVYSLIYEPVSQLLYASIPATSPTNPNSILPIDPVTGNLGIPIAVDSNPRQIAASSDGQYLYAGIDGAHELQRINLVTQKVDRTFALPLSSGLSLVVGNLMVVPGSPQLVVATFSAPGIPPGGYGTALFNDAGLVTWLQTFQPDEIAFAGNPPILYGKQGFQANSFSALTVSNTGFQTQTTSVASTTHQITGNTIASDGIFIYDGSGQIWNPLSPQTLVSTYPNPLNLPSYAAFGIIPDKTLGRTFFLDWDYTYGQTSGVAIQAFDQSSLSLEAAVPFIQATPINGSVALISQPASLARWGTNGFAFLTNLNSTPSPSVEQQIVIFQSNTIASGVPGPNPIPVISVISPSGTAAGEPMNQEHVYGVGFASNAVGSWNGNPRATTVYSSTHLSFVTTNADVAFPGAASVTVTNPTPGGGTSQPATFAISVSTQATFAPSTLTFGAQTIHVVSAPQTITLTNSGAADMSIYGIQAGGDFSETNNCPATLAGGKNCAITVTFTPTATGSRQGTVSVSDSLAAAPQTVSLSGIGAVPDFSLSSSSPAVTAQTVNPGQSATYPLSLTGGTGYSGTVSFTCTQVPVNYTCTINPPTLQIQSGSTASFMVTVATPSSAAIGSFRIDAWKFLTHPLSGMFLSFALACLICMMDSQRGPQAGISRLIMTTTICLVIFLGIAACGGGGASSAGSAGSGPASLPQSYTIQVVASDGATTHTIPLTLTVQ